MNQLNTNSLTFATVPKNKSTLPGTFLFKRRHVQGSSQLEDEFGSEASCILNSKKWCNSIYGQKSKHLRRDLISKEKELHQCEEDCLKLDREVSELHADSEEHYFDLAIAKDVKRKDQLALQEMYEQQKKLQEAIRKVEDSVIKTEAEIIKLDGVIAHSKIQLANREEDQRNARLFKEITETEFDELRMKLKGNITYAQKREHQRKLYTEYKKSVEECAYVKNLLSDVECSSEGVEEIESPIESPIFEGDEDIEEVHQVESE